jgi:UDP-N-acetylmuramoylalanine--D-glutamate ligase
MYKTHIHDEPKTLVVGLGESGYSVLRFLARRGVPPAVADSRATPPMMQRALEEFPDLELHLGPFSPALFETYERIVVSPGVAVSEPAIRNADRAGAEIIGDVELFARQADAPVIAVTGSNGKSTVTALVGELLAAAGVEARVGGNIGVPVLDLLDDDAPRFYVLELSSFQLETTFSLHTASAVVLNVTPDHMDRYADLAAYRKAKARIYARCDACVVNRDDPVAAGLASGDCRRRVVFGLSEPESSEAFGIAQRDERSWIAKGSHRLVAIDELTIQGSHNVSNMLAALALVDAAGVTISRAVMERARSFGGLPHRMELVAERNRVRWINDSKATNVGSACAAMKGIDEPIVLIAGGQGKGADFSPLAIAAEGRVRCAILIGEDRRLIAAALEGRIPLLEAGSLEQAVEQAGVEARPGDVILFSPACASFDMFRNFEHRGDTFRALARREAACKR